MTTLVLSVSGVHCASCGIAIDGAVETLVGVAESRTDVRRRRTTVTLNPLTVTPAQVVAAIERAGYGASVDGRR